VQGQTDLFFYRFQLLFAGIFAITFIVLVSALVTAVGSHSVLDARTHPSVANIIDTSGSETPDAVTSDIYWLVNSTQHAALSAGSALYGTCRSITNLASRSGKTTAHGSTIVAKGMWSATRFAVRGTGDTILFAIRLPSRIARPVTSGHAVASIIRPADDKIVPVISSETSAAVYARFSAQQQQQIANLLTAQVVANQELGGVIVAGDPNHGGYPAKWDAPIRQDSSLDNWGMYNRECVSYVAWKVYQTYGHMPYWGGVGNANQWVRDARRAGIPTSSVPHVHAVAISMRGYYGHAMWVEKISGDMIYVSQYNYDLHGHYSEMWVNGGSFTYIYFS